ncbi:MAG TPA: ATP-binding protein [Anaerovoracaceae bacterium]|nr:ATP-binding protein [Anaerovoracaceae bacterium]
MVNNGLVEDLGCAFTSLTGYSKSDFCQKQISEVMCKLFGFELDLPKSTSSEYYLFKKSCEAIEVQINVYQVGRGNHKLYLFQPKNNFLLNSELSLVGKMMKENYLGVGLFSCPDFRLLKANGRFMEYMQEAWRAEGNLIGRCLNEMVENQVGSKTEAMWQNILNTGETAYLKAQQTVGQNGGIRYWNASIHPISEEGRIKYIVPVLDDVTEDMLKRKHIEEKYEELKKTLEMKDEMLMLISHELKTPLSIITSSIQTVELVCNDEMSDKLRKYLNKIRQNTYRQLKLVNNILDNTRVNAGLFRMNRTSVDIVLLTRSIIDTISVFAERKGIKITYRSMMDRSIVNTDVNIYERILLNLLSNAVKFTPEGKSVEVVISQIADKKKQKVCIQVKDNGIGIPNDQKDLIFEKFRRVERIVPRQSEGTGIGLYLVKMLVSLLDGEISVDSKEGVGSTFSLVFPLEKARKSYTDSALVEETGERLMAASAIEFSDIYYGA